MPEGPRGGPRPFAECKLVYIVTFSGETSLDRDPPSAKNVFSDESAGDVGAFEFITAKIGSVLLAVNNLGGRSDYRILEVDIREQGPGSGLSENETRWTARYYLKGVGMGRFAQTLTSANSMIDAHKVLIEGDDEPIEQSEKIRTFDSGPFEIESIQVEAV